MKYMYLVLVSVTACIAQAPSWYTEVSLPEYPQSIYIIGVGVGDTYPDAQADAQAAISAQLRVTIKSTLETFAQEIATDERTSYIDMVTQATHSTVDETVDGIEIVRQIQEENKYYVFGVLDKNQFVAGLKAELLQLWGKVSALVTDARAFANEGKILAAIENYSEGQRYAAEFHARRAFHDALSPIPFIVDEAITVSGIMSEVRGILSGIQIVVESGDRQSATAGSFLEEPIIFKVFYVSEDTGERIPMHNLPIVTRQEDGVVIDRSVTDATGAVEVFASAVPSSSSSSKLYARPNLVRLPSIYNRYLKNAEGTATYSIAKSIPLSFELIIIDEDGNRLSDVERKVARMVGNLGHSTSPTASMMLSGNVSILGTKEIPGKSNPQYLVTSELALAVVIKSTNTSVSSLSASAKGLSSKSRELAVKASYSKLKLSRNDFSRMISDAEKSIQQSLIETSAEFLTQGVTFYNQTRYMAALRHLSKVKHGESQIIKASELISEIKAILLTLENERQQKEKEQREKQFILELEQIRNSRE